MMITWNGCRERGPTYVPVTGTVKYSDGTVPTGDIASITFQPASPSPDTKAASGSISPDGSFALTSVKPGDGAKPGEYVVTVYVTRGYPAGEMLVADRFTKTDATPLKANVKESGGNNFNFVVERP
jgi:hypothetical protein